MRALRGFDRYSDRGRVAGDVYGIYCSFSVNTETLTRHLAKGMIKSVKCWKEVSRGLKRDSELLCLKCDGYGLIGLEFDGQGLISLELDGKRLLLIDNNGETFCWGFNGNGSGRRCTNKERGILTTRGLRGSYSRRWLGKRTRSSRLSKDARA